METSPQFDTPSCEKAVYDQIGSSYDETRSADSVIVKTICKLLSANPNSHYLDIRCGSGNYTVALSQLGYQMTGIDISEEMLSKARKKSHSITWVNGNAKKLQFRDNEFEGIEMDITQISFEEKIKDYIDKQKIDCEYLTFEQSCHSVSDAALAANADIS